MHAMDDTTDGVMIQRPHEINDHLRLSIIDIHMGLHLNHLSCFLLLSTIVMRIERYHSVPVYLATPSPPAFYTAGVDVFTPG